MTRSALVVLALLPLTASGGCLGDCITGNAVEGTLVEGGACDFGLFAPDSDEMADFNSRIDDIATIAGGELTLSELMSELDRTAQAGLTQGIDSPDAVGFHWDSDDFVLQEWFNQGVSGSSDAYDDGLFEGRHLLLSAWYSKNASPIRGTRLTIADITDLQDVRYVHVLLAEAVDGPDFESLKQGEGSLHAGGIVWYGDLLYVAHTSRGFRVFDMTRIIPATRVDDPDAIGVDGADIHAAGIRFVALQTAWYRTDDDVESVSLSFAGLDRSTDPPTLISGEYQRADFTSRLVRWPMDPTSDWMVEADDTPGRVRASATYFAGQRRLQGVASWNGDLVMSASSQEPEFDENEIEGPDNHNEGRLFRASVGGQSEESPWVDGAEDLYLDRTEDRVWTTSEYPGLRDVTGVPR
jgi:hypothetical protein